MRLIDADMLKKYIMDNGKETERFLQYIDEQPTAYNLEKVVENLERQRRIWGDLRYDRFFEGEEMAMEKAIKIVRDGVMTEQEKNDREQLEYLKRWQEKKKQKCKKTNVFRKILQRRGRR